MIKRDLLRLTGICSLLIALLWISSVRADNYVTERGSAAPEPGSSTAPFMLIESAVLASDNPSVIIEGGNYRETVTISVPTTLRAIGSAAKIGDLSASASTTIDIVTLNTHLFGDLVFGGGTFQDDARAVDIADIAAGLQADILCFQEIWDEDLFYGGDGQTGILPRSGYASGFHGEMTDCIICGNSGLATMSLHSLVGFEQLFFSDCPGNPCNSDDCLSAKGWIKSVIYKDGFRIAIVNTHTQADYDEPGQYQTTRQSQLGCLFDWVENYRLQSPNTVVFVVGDFNVVGEGAEYLAMTKETLPSAARDAGRNVPQWRGQDGGYTTGPINILALCFDEDTILARLDYIYFFPSYDGQVTVVPRTTVVYPFRGAARTDSCSDVPGPVTTTEKSDHYAVKGSFNLYRQ